MYINKILKLPTRSLLLINNYVKDARFMLEVNNSFLRNLNLQSLSTTEVETDTRRKISTNINGIEFKNDWSQAEKTIFVNDMIIHEDFVTESEEASLLNEIEPYIKRLRYEFDHWDDAIHGYRETERKHWYPQNKLIIQRVSDVAFQGKIMPYIHVLDLAEDGVIKPHVDSTRYCGSIIAGISLLSDCVMRLVRIDEKLYDQNKSSPLKASLNTEMNGEYRLKPSEINLENKSIIFADVLLKQRSLYIMRNTARYNFTHEILAKAKSIFNNREIIKQRRISIICRNDP